MRLKDDISALKELVYEKRKTTHFRDVDTADLVLWTVCNLQRESKGGGSLRLTSQVDIDLDAHNKDSRSRLRAEKEGGAEFDDMKPIMSYWSPEEQAPNDKLHVIVQVPSAGEWEVIPAYE
jgi:hypothetical protein